ncbi:glutamic acid-rich protein isoform X2 [Patella vulgata]|uniref:glutamic acid-rich protein isoform X2 n=1 Tax=Patella vulgata TaxID=6465 RepID=UPI00217F38B7|nr:glutamic acid-rich protein isoform X2 [Patella vulgata]
MQRDRFMHGGLGRDEYEYDQLRNQRSGLLPREREYEMDNQGAYSTGLLGEGPGAMRPRVGGGGGGGVSGGLLSDPLLGGVVAAGNDSLTAGLQEQLLQHKRLEQQLNLRESQLALASNLLQQQNKMLGDIQTGTGLMGPAPGNIPSLLDNLPRKRVNEGARMDHKRSRFDEGPARSQFGDRRDDRRAHSDDRAVRRREDVYDPEYPTGERGFSKHLHSRRHEDRVRGVGEVAKNSLDRNKAQQHLRNIEGQDFCRICDETLRIPFEHHKRTTIHKKRFQQTNMGCGWCNVRGFNNFREVLKHRDTKKHIENEKKMKGKDSTTSSSSSRRDSRKNDKDDDDVVIIGEKKADKKSDTRRKSNGSSRPSSKPATKKVEEKPKEDPNVFNVKDLEEAEKIEFDAERAIGQNLVVPVTGFFCKLCHKFYNNEEAAKVGHCKTQIHFDKYKATMIAKFKKKAESEAKVKEEAAKKAAEKKEAEEAKKTESKATEDSEKVDVKKENGGDITEAVQNEAESNEAQELGQNTSLEEPENIDLSSADPVYLGYDEDKQADEQTDDVQQLAEDEEENNNQDDTMEADESSILDAEGENEEGTEVEEEAEAEKESTEATPTAKSPRGRVRTGKSRGGKAKRGKK